MIIWDAATGSKVSELKGHSGGVTSVAWSPRAPRHTHHLARVPFQLRAPRHTGNYPRVPFQP